MRFILHMLRSFTLRCPHCRGSRMFRNPYALHEKCAVCGFVFQGEEGDFWGGMVFSYTFAGLVGLATAGLLLRLTALEGEWIAYLSAGTALSSILVVFPFAKSLWVYLLQFTRGRDAEYRPPNAERPGATPPNDTTG